MGLGLILALWCRFIGLLVDQTWNSALRTYPDCTSLENGASILFRRHLRPGPLPYSRVTVGHLHTYL